MTSIKNFQQHVDKGSTTIPSQQAGVASKFQQSFSMEPKVNAEDFIRRVLPNWRINVHPNANNLLPSESVANASKLRIDDFDKVIVVDLIANKWKNKQLTNTDRVFFFAEPMAMKDTFYYYVHIDEKARDITLLGKRLSKKRMQDHIDAIYRKQYGNVILPTTRGTDTSSTTVPESTERKATSTFSK